MRPRDEGEPARTALDRWTADRLLDGSVAPDDAPPGFGEVARLLRAVAAPPSPRELASAAGCMAAARSVLAVLSAATPGGSGVPAPRTRSRALRRARVAALVTVGALIGTSGLAAAGVLPDPVQSVVSRVLDTVGIRVPKPSAVDRPASTGKEISEIATTTDTKGVDKGAEVSDTASGGTGRAGEEHGPPAGNDEREEQDRGASEDAQKGKPDDPGSQGANEQGSSDPQGEDERDSSDPQRGKPDGSDPQGEDEP